jgi:phospholipase C
VALATKFGTYTDTTLGDLLTAKGVKWSWYAEGYDVTKNAGGACPDPPPDCTSGIHGYPCTFDPGDIPIEYYATTRDNPAVMQDMTKFMSDVSGGTLPAVSFLKTLGYKSEHPNNGMTITAGMTFISSVVNAIQSSKLASDTLLIVTYDEGGGYFDHVATPEINKVDTQPYGTRVPMVAVGPFVKKNFVSHVVMEHSSIVKFIEWNWLGQQTGQLNGRDKAIANIGSLLDEKATGVKVPED